MPGFHNTTYMKLKSLRQQLKSSIKLKEKSYHDNNGSLLDTSSNTSKIIKDEMSPKMNKSLNISNTDSNSSTKSLVLLDDSSDMDDFDLSISKKQKRSPKNKSIGHNSTKNGFKIKEKSLVSQTDRNTHLNDSIKLYSDNESSNKKKFTENSPIRTLPKPVMQKPVSLLQPCSDNSLNSSILNISDEPSACVPNSNENLAAKKGKFVFKRPSTLSTTTPLSKSSTSSTTEPLSNTLKKIELAKQNLKPVNTPEPSNSPGPSLNNSSVPFQPSKQASVMMKEPNVVTHLPIRSNSFGKDIEVIESEEEYTNAYSQNFECDFSFASSPMTKNASCNESSSKEPSMSRTLPEVDEDGWPIYNEEDFANIEDLELNSSTTANDIPNVSNQKSNKLGNFYSNVKNDGVTGNYLIE